MQEDYLIKIFHDNDYEKLEEQVNAFLRTMEASDVIKVDVRLDFDSNCGNVVVHYKTDKKY